MLLGHSHWWDQTLHCRAAHIPTGARQRRKITRSSFGLALHPSKPLYVHSVGQSSIAVVDDAEAESGRLIPADAAFMSLALGLSVAPRHGIYGVHFRR